jgi:hypothetical protein
MLRISKTRSLILLCLVLMLPPSARDESDGRRDGNWWRSQSSDAKYNYMTGFIDGLQLGHDFSYWKFIQKNGDCASLVSDSYNTHLTKYLVNVTNGQIADGLTSFYEDYRNRRILTSRAVWLVLNEIAGTLKDVENWRKNADE